MAVTLVTELQDLMFSSQIPDLVISLGDDNEAEVCIDTGDYNIFSASHFPYGRSITVHDVRSVIEYYLRDRNLTLDKFSLSVKHNGTTTSLREFQVICMEQHFTGDTAEFLRNNFLTTQSARLTSKAIDIEQRIAEEYVSPEQLAVFRDEVFAMSWDFSCEHHGKRKVVGMSCHCLTFQPLRKSSSISIGDDYALHCSMI